MEEVRYLHVCFLGDLGISFEMCGDIRSIYISVDCHSKKVKVSLLAAAREGNLLHAQAYLRQGSAEVDFQDEDGWTALMWAATEGHEEVVMLLLHANADVNAVDNVGSGALYWAASEGQVDIVGMLIVRGADIDSANNDGWTATMCAASEGHIEVVALLADNGASLCAASNDGWTASLCAANEGHVELARLLLERGADVNAANNNGWTALMCGAVNGYLEVVRVLVQGGADLNAVNNDGWTATMCAVSEGCVDVAELLASSGADDRAASTAHRSSLADIPRRDITLSDQISSGALSTVFNGRYRAAEVAVKILRGDRTHSADALKVELAVLSQLHHPRVVTLLGVCRDLQPSEGAVALVMEFMQRGSLFKILHSVEWSSVTSNKRMRVAMDVCNGMRFVHLAGVVHRDLTSRNILLDDVGRAKVANFGLNSYRVLAMSMDMGITDDSVRSLAWTAPEVIESEDSKKPSANVYSYGVILWELFTGQVPWAGKTAVQIMRSSLQGMHLPISSTLKEQFPAMSKMISRCFETASARPTFEQLYEELTTLLMLEAAQKQASPNVRYPHIFICPIGYELMGDPVVCADGHSYERNNIEHWLRQSNRSPATNLALPNKTLIPNLALRHLIEEAVLNNSSLPLPVPLSLPPPGP